MKHSRSVSMYGRWAGLLAANSGALVNYFAESEVELYLISPCLHKITNPTTHCHTLTPTHCHTLTPTQCHTLTPTHCHSLTPTHCHSLTPTHCHILTPAHCHAHTYTVTSSHLHTVTSSYLQLPPPHTLHLHTVTLTPAHCHILTPAHYHTLTPTHCHTLTLTFPQELNDSRLSLHHCNQELHRVGRQLQQVEGERRIQTQQLEETQNALRQAIRSVDFNHFFCLKEEGSGYNTTSRPTK